MVVQQGGGELLTDLSFCPSDSSAHQPSRNRTLANQPTLAYRDPPRPTASLRSVLGLSVYLWEEARAGLKR